jgi:predicted transcriptional regulator
MEVHFTPEQEALLAQAATHNGKQAEQLVKDATLHMLENEARFRAGVRKGIEAADCGEFVEEEEMDARIERLLQS